MEEVAQGRVWSGADAASRGLVDAVGGLSRAIAIAKEKANIPQDRQVIYKIYFHKLRLSKIYKWLLILYYIIYLIESILLIAYTWNGVRGYIQRSFQ